MAAVSRRVGGGAAAHAGAVCRALGRRRGAAPPSRLARQSAASIEASSSSVSTPALTRYVTSLERARCATAARSGLPTASCSAAKRRNASRTTAHSGHAGSAPIWRGSSRSKLRGGMTAGKPESRCLDFPTICLISDQIIQRFASNRSSRSCVPRGARCRTEGATDGPLPLHDEVAGIGPSWTLIQRGEHVLGVHAVADRVCDCGHFDLWVVVGLG